MYLTHEQVPEGSYVVRGFLDPNAVNEGDIDLVVFLLNLGGGICEVSAAKGTLTPEGNINLGLKAMELGFKHLQFHALKGNKVTRWATQIGSDDQFDYYTIDLYKALEELSND